MTVLDFRMVVSALSENTKSDMRLDPKRFYLVHSIDCISCDDTIFRIVFSGYVSQRQEFTKKLPFLIRLSRREARSGDGWFLYCPFSFRVVPFKVIPFLFTAVLTICSSSLNRLNKKNTICPGLAALEYYIEHSGFVFVNLHLNENEFSFI